MRAIVTGIVGAMLSSSVACAQQSKVDLVLIPRDVASTALSWIAQPDPSNAVRLYVALNACISNNPLDGVVTRSGPDQCPGVTAAIEQRDKEIADLKKQLAEAKAPHAPAAPAK